MKRPILIENEELFAVLDERRMTPAMKARRPERVLPEITNLSVGGKGKKKAATMFLYDAVSFWTGNDARTFQRKLAETDAEEIHLHINSPGGSVFEGVAIYNLLAGHEAEVIVHIDGLAASIASVIALAGDTIHIAENGMVMIHNPSVVAWGDSTMMRKQAEILDKIRDAILNTYETRTRMGREDLSAEMEAETWYSADEAIKAGFAMHKTSAREETALWVPGDFEGLPAAAMMLGRKSAELGAGSGEEEDGNRQDAKSAKEERGSLEDVAGAADFIARMKLAHGL
ncbi:Clp protease ClpP [Luteolibacter sp. GHJ8]|uniref:ATP-dependent Clp protease proteolytic subunit n=1 Tax=Luteolibacter rhizosphaerae TaxID=2989719 RepID=A0ABT3G824_9BACT|nr:head maturation protease, ClpP-related [Luteolibacter rhizosphaerae]MCW1916002.1 Clp protease ClpP [Luteolibacter rhizosphaerae]